MTENNTAAQQVPQSDCFEGVGVTEEELCTYVKDNTHKFIPSFKNFAHGTQTSWNWVVFLLTLFIGPIAGAFWFLHRRMNKIAAVILALGVIYSGATVFISFKFGNEVSAVTRDAISQYEQRYGKDNYISDSEAREFINDYDTDVLANSAKKLIPAVLLGVFLFVIKIAAAVVLSLFANYLYYKSAVEKITEIKQSGAENPMPQIAFCGGTKEAAWIVATIVYILAILACGGIITAKLVIEIVQFIN